MSAGKIEDENDVSKNKQLVQGMCAQDGVLVSPIDLTLNSTKPLQLEPLRWFNFDVPPFRMKLTNSGDTLVVSAKWAKERPYLCGGPLDGNYVFSQVHFHWGSSEHEGSEHTVRGICYPMEMHVVFFKTRYLTQAAALKQDDGIVILAYLFRLQARSAPGLHWLASQLENVMEPRTSAQVPPMPLATVLVPFDSDYVTYWGALVSQKCRHPVMWLVSRTALAISSEDLNLFRSMLNSRKEAMTKNFRATSPAGGRAIFHINPSSEINNLLLPGAVDPPCQAVIVNYSQLPPAHQTEAKKIFDKGDSNELEAKDSLRDKKHKEQVLKSRTRFLPEGTKRKIIGDVTNIQQKSSLTDSEAPDIRRLSPSSDKSLDKKPKVGPKLQRQCTTTKKQLGKESSRKADNTGLQEQKVDCVKINTITSYILPSGKPKEDEKTSPDIKNGNAKENKANNEKQPKKSRLPVPKGNTKKGGHGLESRYASYFKRPESAPTDQATTKPQTPTPRPSTRNGPMKS